MALKEKLVLDIRREEWPAFAGAFVYFFLVLCAYYVLRPVREEMAIQAGLKNITWLYTGVFVGMLLMTPLFGWISSRLPRRIFLPIVYLFFSSNLILFYAAMKGQLPFIDAAQTAIAFFIWLSVFNYMIVSVFWSFMTDIFNDLSAKRLFGAIAAGGSAGAMVGPIITSTLVTAIGIPNLLLISATLLMSCIGCILYLNRWAVMNVDTQRGNADAAIGGGIWDGIKLTFSSPYLLGICVYVMLLQMVGNVFYVEQLRVVSIEIPTPALRTQFFAQLDLAVNALALFIQLFITSAMLRKLGIVFCLTVLPIIGVILLTVTGLAPTLMVVAVCTVIRRTAEFAIAKPAREVLFTVASREERYKAKNVVDTVVSRGADTIATWGTAGLRGLGLGTSQITFAAIPLALVMVGFGAYLGRQQQQRAAAQAALQKPAQTDAIAVKT